MINFESEDVRPQFHTQSGTPSGGAMVPDENLPSIHEGEPSYYVGASIPRASVETQPKADREKYETPTVQASAPVGDAPGWERDPTALSQLPREAVAEALGDLVIPRPLPGRIPPATLGTENYLA